MQFSRLLMHFINLQKIQASLFTSIQPWNIDEILQNYQFKISDEIICRSPAMVAWIVRASICHSVLYCDLAFDGSNSINMPFSFVLRSNDQWIESPPRDSCIDSRRFFMKIGSHCIEAQQTMKINENCDQ